MRRAAAKLPQQPNPLQLRLQLRKRLTELCGKPDFTPDDVMALDYTPALFFLRLPRAAPAIPADWMS
ncbi:hypothetical protein NLM27_26720 [Bradyrhizobium sp. CCGB12]|uniref:hypothetical protein n=1 Tax=Bradyrhizobium sp. CCGB12 TaxID=2949632 RepID=UPI0020B3F710|nr:hypothetical protein [Bradyrhizobium sp. CCGB12]MCP3392347.1 hypothetical protein [Bradyrhizobium sp. CCGB12]